MVLFRWLVVFFRWLASLQVAVVLIVVLVIVLIVATFVESWLTRKFPPITGENIPNGVYTTANGSWPCCSWWA